MVDEPPTNDKIHVEVFSTSSRIGLLHPKVHIAFIAFISILSLSLSLSELLEEGIFNIWKL